MAINLKDTVQIIRGKKADIAARTGANGELNWADDTYELYIHDGKTRGGHLIGKASGTAGVVGGAGIAVSTSDGISTVSIKRDPSNVLYATTDGAGVRIGTSGALQITAQNALDLRVAEGGGIIVDSSGVKIDSAVLSSVFRYAGQVNSVDDLPSDAQPGDVYDVKDSGANYVWSGTSWDNLGGILSVDSSPTQGSTNPVASGGVYDAIQDAKLNGDGTTVSVVDNTITAKDIAIGGDVSDLASMRGIFNSLGIGAQDFNNLKKQGIYSIPNTDSSNGPGFSCRLVVLSTNGSIVNQIAIGEQRLSYRYYQNDSWTAWRLILADNTIGDGITVNNGIISVPEYEGATADAAGTSGLVPPAAAGQEGYVLGGDGEWHTVPEGVTLSDSVTSTSSTTAASSKAVKTAYDKAVSATTAATTVMTGATASAAGKAGLVPAPAKGCQSRPLRGDGTWATSLACNITGLAAKATADAGGNTITTTYATKSEVSAQKTALEAEIEAAAVQPSGTTPKAPGTASAGTETAYARGDHVHPAQTSVSGNAGTATKLATARTIRTNLASTSTASFDGSANVTPGVTGILPIANGGTGNSTGTVASATKAVQDGNGNTITTTYATKSEVSAFQGAYLPLAGGTMMGGLFGTAVALSGSAIDVSTGSCFTKVITASTTFTITGAPSGAVGCFSLILTDGGSRTVTWPSSVKWTEGTPPELASSGIDVITFLTADGGTTWYGVHSVQGAA